MRNESQQLSSRSEPDVVAIPDPPLRSPGSAYELVIGLDWDWDETRGKILDNRTGLDLLVDGKPNPAIRDAPTRPGYVAPSWKDPNADWLDDPVSTGEE